MTDRDTEVPGKLTFPCEIGIKAFGLHSDDFVELVTSLVMQHVPADAIIDVRMRDSSGSKYISVTCEVRLESREQMEGIYTAMHAHDDVLMTL